MGGSSRERSAAGDAGQRNGRFVLNGSALERLAPALGARPAASPGISSERTQAVVAGANRIFSGYIERAGNTNPGGCNRRRSAIGKDTPSFLGGGCNVFGGDRQAGSRDFAEGPAVVYGEPGGDPSVRDRSRSHTGDGSGRFGTSDADRSGLWPAVAVADPTRHGAG